MSVVIVGAGAQGLALLDHLVSQGVEAVVLSRYRKEGCEVDCQAEVNHGFMHAGYAFGSMDTLSPPLLQDWPEELLQEIKRKDQKCWFVAPEKQATPLTTLWDSAKFPYRITPLPHQYANGAMEGMKALETEDFVYDKLKLLDLLGNKHSKRILYGDIDSIDSSSNTIHFQIHNGDYKSFTFSKLFLCAGTGNYSIMKSISKETEVKAPQKTLNLHMLCVRGSRNLLPLDSVLCWNLQMMVIAHPIGESETIYYISIFNKEQYQLVGINSTEAAVVDENVIQSAVERFFTIFPMAEEKKNELQWSSYSCWKNEHPTASAHHQAYCDQAYSNNSDIIVVNPSIIANIFRCAKLAHQKLPKDFQNIQPELPSTTYTPANEPAIKWQSWADFAPPTLSQL